MTVSHTLYSNAHNIVATVAKQLAEVARQAVGGKFVMQRTAANIKQHWTCPQRCRSYIISYNMKPHPAYRHKTLRIQGQAHVCQWYTGQQQHRRKHTYRAH